MKQPVDQKIVFNWVCIPTGYRQVRRGMGLNLPCKPSMGTSHQALDGVLAYVRQRKQFGLPNSEFQNIQFCLADFIAYVGH